MTTPEPATQASGAPFFVNVTNTAQAATFGYSRCRYYRKKV